MNVHKYSEWIVRPGLEDKKGISFEAAHLCGYYLTHDNLQLQLGTAASGADATWYHGGSEQNGWFESGNFPSHFLVTNGNKVLLQEGDAAFMGSSRFRIFYLSNPAGFLDVDNCNTYSPHGDGKCKDECSPFGSKVRNPICTDLYCMAYAPGEQLHDRCKLSNPEHHLALEECKATCGLCWHDNVANQNKTQVNSKVSQPMATGSIIKPSSSNVMNYTRINPQSSGLESHCPHLAGGQGSSALTCMQSCNENALCNTINFKQGECYLKNCVQCRPADCQLDLEFGGYDVYTKHTQVTFTKIANASQRLASHCQAVTQGDATSEEACKLSCLLHKECNTINFNPKTNSTTNLTHGECFLKACQTCTPQNCTLDTLAHGYNVYTTLSQTAPQHTSMGLSWWLGGGAL